jgi:hypothetical protein
MHAAMPLALSVLLLAGGCSAEPFQAAQGRAYRGGVHVLRDGGTQRTPLQIDSAFPQLDLSSAFDLRVAGAADEERYAIHLRIELLRQLARYRFPADKQELAVAVTRGEQAVRIDGISGFLDVLARDAAEVPGRAVVSVALHDAGGYAVAELDLVFGQAADGG